MSLQNELAKIREGQTASVYVLLGTEQFLIDTFKETLVAQQLNEDDREFNVISFDMTEVPVSEAVLEAETLPFFGESKVVFMENPSFLTGEKAKPEPVHNLDALLEYIQQPSPETTLVITAPYEKLDERKKLVKQLKKQAVLVDVNMKKEKDIRQYVRQYIENQGFSITPEAFEQFVYLSDMDLSRMMNELAKLFLYVGQNGKITKDVVDGLIPKTLEHNVFDLVSNVMKRDKEAAMRLYQDLLLLGEEPIKLNAILISQFRLLTQVKTLMSMSYNQSHIVDVLKIHPYRVKLAMQQVRGLDLALLGSIYDELVENDYRIKTGQMDKQLVFELFLLKDHQL